MAKQRQSVQKIRLFAASPGDVKAEREHLRHLVGELNTTVAPYKNSVIELVRWETHCQPGMGRTQGVINAQIGTYDIFLGMMWKRFGTPTGVTDSGTEEEFRRAYRCWERDHTLPILFYFSQAPFTPRGEEELQQCSAVLRFRAELESLGLVWEYRDAADFPDVVRPHLYRIILNFPSAGVRRTATVPAQPEKSGRSSPKVATRRVQRTSPQQTKPLRVFIGSSSEGLPTARRVREALREMGIETALWDDQFEVGQPFIAIMDQVLDKCSAAVMVLTPDDQVLRRGDTHPVARDNLVYEIGLFHGRHGRNRTFVLATGGLHLPSDLAGIVYLRYDPGHLESTINQLRRELLNVSVTSPNQGIPGVAESAAG
jgi:predicted nucleotide-binding protein